MNKKLAIGIIAFLAVILILGTIGYIGLHKYKWNANYDKKAKEMANRTGSNEHKQWIMMGQGYSQQRVPLVSRGVGMMYYRIGHDGRRHGGGGLIGLLVLILVAFGAYYFFSKREKKSKPLEILKERFARSEITKEQYEEMKKVLE